jgi:hypothetical protein
MVVRAGIGSVPAPGILSSAARKHRRCNLVVNQPAEAADRKPQEVLPSDPYFHLRAPFCVLAAVCAPSPGFFWPFR